ncbi:MAG: NADH-quinone oxidoreductase subunit NuoF [Lachnospiraceae bacterium]|nr:NADH-quinone oxidoreductase subunit NuoF [Lachnospiraceae bacterium]
MKEKITTLKALLAVREAERRYLQLRLEDKFSLEEGEQHKNILVCAGTGCTAGDSAILIKKLNEKLEEAGLAEEVKVVKTGCFGFCQKGPIVAVYPDRVYYTHVKPDDAERIVNDHVIGGHVIKDLQMFDTDRKTGEKVYDIDKIGFYEKQQRIALRNCGRINPENIYEYIGIDGYEALYRVLTEKTPQEVIDIVKASGLRGRGGAGFPTGLKWQFEKDQPGDEKYVICNADEGDPGAFMDRSILEGDPHAILEGMAIMAYAVGAHQGYVYIRAEYPIAVNRLRIAIREAKELGLLGENIFGTGFNFDIEIRLGAGAFVCGEETALIASIMGKRGMPSPKPPFPAVSGVWQKPTSINNVETIANITQIILNGPEWYAAMGMGKSTGTKVFALGGKINNTGLVEIPMGTTLREIIYDIGGGCPEGKKFKAVQTGGPSGGCLTEKELDTPITYENLVAAGSMMGSGGMIVLDEDNCMVDVAKFYMEFICDESCGKCTPCRIGTKRLLEMLTKITEGNGTMEMLDEMEELCNEVRDGALCGLGQTAPNPILSTLRYFRDEYEAHILEKRCPAHVCKKLLTYVINPDKCKCCSLCARNCPADAITGKPGKEVYKIDAEKCIKCGLCITNCKFGAVERH